MAERSQSELVHLSERLTNSCATNKNRSPIARPTFAKATARQAERSVPHQIWKLLGVVTISMGWPSYREALRQRGAQFCFHLSDVTRVDRPIRVHVRTEVGRINRLPNSRFGLRDIGGVYAAIAIRVTDEHAHLHTHVARGHSVTYTGQRHCDPLGISYTS